MRHTVALIPLSHPLTKVTLLTKLLRVFLHGRPPLSTLPDFAGCGVAEVVPSCNSVEHFSKYGIFFELVNPTPPYAIRFFVI